MATNKSYIYKMDKDTLIDRFNKGESKILAKELGYSDHCSFLKSVRKIYGLENKNDIASVPEPEVKYIPYPEIKLSPFKPAKLKRDEEDIVIVIADPHIGKITQNYNIDTAKRRFDYLLNSAETIINLHRPIRKAHIFMLGDIVQGENAFQGSKVGETSGGVFEQIHDNAIPIIEKFCLSLAQGVGSVDVYGVRGNHGRYAREAPDKTNWDRFFYQSLKDATVNQKKVNVYPAIEFYQLVNIRGFRFFLIHGDQARGNAAVPVIALRRKMQEWFAYIKNGFNYAYAGHFHSEYFDHINTEADYTICPPLVTGDEWAIEMVGRASQPKQIAFGVHDKYGRTFRYDLVTDEAFLPRKYDDPEGEVKI